MTAVLVVDGAIPAREASAGERATIDLLDGLLSLGYDVAFTALGVNGDEAVRTAALQARGVVVQPGHGGGTAHLAAVLEQTAFEYVIVHRPGPGVAALHALRSVDTVTILFGHDIHQWRLRAQQALTADVPTHQMLVTQVAEARCWQGYDLCVYPTRREARHVDGWAMPYYRLTDEDLPSLPRGPRRGCLMVGASSHAPNRDALAVAVTQIQPLARESLTVVGDWPVLDRQAYLSHDVRFTGRVPEEQLRQLHHDHLALLAPLRFGAGSRRKLVAAMGLGLPVITTAEGAQGLLVDDAGDDDSVTICNDAPAMALAVQHLRRRPAQATLLAQRAQDRVRAVYGQPRYDDALQEMLDQARERRRRT